MSELLKHSRGQTKRERARRDSGTPLRPGAPPERQRTNRQVQQLAYLLLPANQKISLNLELNVGLN